jgi:hypothetical protein
MGFILYLTHLLVSFSLQLPLFDMLRVLFHSTARDGRSSMGGAGRNTQSLCLAIELWLLYIQPWSAPAIAAGAGSHRSQEKRLFAEKWRPYVVLNLHFYTTLLACFLRMMAVRCCLYGVLLCVLVVKNATDTPTLTLTH